MRDESLISLFQVALLLHATPTPANYKRSCNYMKGIKDLNLKAKAQNCL